jgi:hypothetical protein
MYIYFEETDCEVMDLIEVAQDNAEWRTLLNRLINHLVP